MKPPLVSLNFFTVRSLVSSSLVDLVAGLLNSGRVFWRMEFRNQQLQPATNETKAGLKRDLSWRVAQLINLLLVNAARLINGKPTSYIRQVETHN